MVLKLNSFDCKRSNIDLKNIEEEECKYAAKSMSLKYDTHVSSHHDPKGCFQDQDGSIKFNRKIAGRTGRLVCRRTRGRL